MKKAILSATIAALLVAAPIYAIDDIAPGSWVGGALATQATHGAYAPACAATHEFDIDWGNGNLAHLDMEPCLQAAININAPTNPVNNAVYTICMEQNDTVGVAAVVLTWNAVFLFPGGTAPVLTTTAEGRDCVSCVYMDTIYHCSFAQDYQ